MIVRRIDPLSCGKMLAVVNAGIALIEAFLLTVYGYGGGLYPANHNGMPAIYSFMVSVGHLIPIPIYAGVRGFLIGLVLAFVYNLAAKYLGGVKIEVASQLLRDEDSPVEPR